MSIRCLVVVCLAVLLLLVFAVPAIATDIRPTSDIVQERVQANLAAGTPWAIGPALAEFGQEHSKAP